MSLIDQYLDLEKQIKERALYVNNLVAEYITENRIDDDNYRVSWCNIADVNHLEFAIIVNKVILSYLDEEGWDTQWEIPVKWIDMSNNDILEDYLVELENRRMIDKMTSIQKLERQAKELGFVLSKQ